MRRFFTHKVWEAFFKAGADFFFLLGRRFDLKKTTFSAVGPGLAASARQGEVPMETKDDIRLLPVDGAAAPARDRCSACTELALAGTAAWAFDWALHNPYCGLLFRCRCTFPWAGGAAACNIHHAEGPRCPWCNVLHTQLWWLAFAITDRFTVLCMLLAYVAVWARQAARRAPGGAPALARWLRSRAPTPGEALLRAAAAALTFLGLGFGLGLAFFLGTDYPCFLWIRDATDCGFAPAANAGGGT
jgi:hypothetical protein